MAQYDFQARIVKFNSPVFVYQRVYSECTLYHCLAGAFKYTLHTFKFTRIQNTGRPASSQSSVSTKQSNTTSAFNKKQQ